MRPTRSSVRGSGASRERPRSRTPSSPLRQCCSSALDCCRRPGRRACPRTKRRSRLRFADACLCKVPAGESRRCALLSSVRCRSGVRCGTRGAEGHHGALRRPRRLHLTRRGDGPGRCSRAARPRTTSAFAASSSGSAAQSRSSSATPSWHCSARRSPTRTIRNAPCARHSQSATGCARTRLTSSFASR